MDSRNSHHVQVQKPVLECKANPGPWQKQHSNDLEIQALVAQSLEHRTRLMGSWVQSPAGSLLSLRSGDTSEGSYKFLQPGLEQLTYFLVVQETTRNRSAYNMMIISVPIPDPLE